MAFTGWDHKGSGAQLRIGRGEGMREGHLRLSKGNWPNKEQRPDEKWDNVSICACQGLSRSDLTPLWKSAKAAFVLWFGNF